MTLNELDSAALPPNGPVERQVSQASTSPQTSPRDQCAVKQSQGDFPGINMRDLAQERKWDQVKALLDAGCNPNIPCNAGYTALSRAVVFDKPDMVKLLLDNKAYPFDANSPSNETSLEMSITWGRTDCLRVFIDHGVDLNRVNCLVVACEMCTRYRGGRSFEQATAENRDMVLLLLNQGASPLVVPPGGLTALHCLAFARQLDCMRRILMIYRDNDSMHLVHQISCPTDDIPSTGWVRGGTPLHSAALGGNPDCVQLLLDAGARWNAKSQSGKLPVHYLVSSWPMRQGKDIIGCLERFHEAGMDWGITLDDGQGGSKNLLQVTQEDGVRPLEEQLRKAHPLDKESWYKEIEKYHAVLDFLQTQFQTHGISLGEWEKLDQNKHQ